MIHYMKNPVLLILGIMITNSLYTQEQVVYPSSIIQGEYLGLSIPFKDAKVLTQQELEELWEQNREHPFNMGLAIKEYPYADQVKDRPDPGLQDYNGDASGMRGIELNFIGDADGSYPPDPCGDVGPNHYVQAYNSAYSIYNKSGTRVAGPTLLNSLFTGLIGGNCNNGDPIILYDEQADRWLIVEFSLCNADDRVMVAVSQTANPTGSYYGYSFDTDEVPDYEKLGVWRDGYYMATNTRPTGDDIYVMERSEMLLGNINPTLVGFENANRPGGENNFMCVPPVDNDGTFAPYGEPGIFICHADNALTSLTNDELWLYELDVNWTTPGSSTFTRVQQITVNAYDSNFGPTWDNIVQQGTAQKLDAIPEVIMNAPQYRNWGSYETIVCCHSVDVGSDQAGVRWYELRRTTGSWYIRQQGTYAPDAHSRWMGSIRLNGNKEIALGYSISSSTLYPGIRYCGQNAIEYSNGNGVLNVAEVTISTGTSYQTGANRWGDYTSLNVDPSDDRTFWYTNMTVNANHSTKTTHIASFSVYPGTIYVDGNAAAGGNGTSGSPIQTIIEAVYAAGAGTTIYIDPGTYQEIQTITKDVDLVRWGSSGSVVIE